MKQQLLVKTDADQKIKVVTLLCSLIVSLSALAQRDAVQPKTFIFSKYQLPAQGKAATSFYSTPLPASPYKIHYKIKTLTFPADTRPEKPTPIAKTIIDGLIETAIKKLFKDDCEENNRAFVPLKPTNAFKY